LMIGAAAIVQMPSRRLFVIDERPIYREYAVFAEI